jgi:heme iron utilization protein
MFIRPESESSNLFAHERAVFNCKVTEIQRNGEIYTAQLKVLQGKFGEVVSLLRSLSDFHLFALRPENGRYVAGFGQAYTIDVKNGTVSRFDKSQS